ncbi:hypothetical protein FRC19_009710 [Serendipita sp. 401]|nr:hypothetical protein FRC19_009710 [Serendipita sp. 401]
MAAAHPTRSQRPQSNFFGPIPLTVCTSHLHHGRRRPHSLDHGAEDDSDSDSVSSEERDEDEPNVQLNMQLDHSVLDGQNNDDDDEQQHRIHNVPHHQHHQHHLHLQPLQPPQPSSQSHPPPPIVVTYGPFHSPDADVAVPYAQMVCYLWFWSPNSTSFDPTASAVQLQPQTHFIQFLNRVITQTQLSKTVLVLALHYLWLLKRPVMAGAAGSHEAEMGPVNAPSELAVSQVHPGSQYTVSVVALMLANKFMDDNTYTNKSWAAICGVTLEKINTMEREFLLAINHALHVDVNRFMSWIRIMQSFFVQRQSRFESRNRPRRVMPLPHHQYQTHHRFLDATSSYATPPRSPEYGRARSASPNRFQFTFVAPNVQTPQDQNPADTHTLPSSVAGRSITEQRPYTQQAIHSYPQRQQQQRPVSSFETDGRSASSFQHNGTGHAQWIDPSRRLTPSEAYSAGAVDALRMPQPLQRSHFKRSASQAFSPQSAEPPRPRPDERIQQHHQHLLHPHPVHAHRHGRPLSAVYPVHPSAHHHAVGSRRLHQVHEVLASRPSTAVEAHFSRMSLSSRGRSPIGDDGNPNRGGTGEELQNAYPHLAAPFDPYTAPSFRNEGANENEPFELEYYQLVQGGRGVLRVQPTVAVPFPVEDAQDQGSEMMSGYDRRDRVNSIGGFSSAPETTITERRSLDYPRSGSLSTDDDEGMSGSESSNGTGWEHPDPHAPRVHHHQQHQQHHQYLQPIGGGYSLPPLSSILGDVPLRFSSPSAGHSSLSPSSVAEKYVQFANAGPPASYAPQWGFQVPASTRYYPHSQEVTSGTTVNNMKSSQLPARQHPALQHEYAHLHSPSNASHLSTMDRHVSLQGSSMHGHHLHPSHVYY